MRYLHLIIFILFYHIVCWASAIYPMLWDEEGSTGDDIKTIGHAELIVIIKDLKKKASMYSYQKCSCGLTCVY